MENQIVTSKLYSLNWRDIAKGFLTAAISAGITVIYESLRAETIVFDWKDIGLVSLTAGFAYLIKNFFTKPEIKTPA